MTVRARLAAVLVLLAASPLSAQAPAGRTMASAGSPPPARDERVRAIVADVSASRLESDLRRLVAFGTRHTLSDTMSTTRGIGAARRWIKAQFDSISTACGGCLQVSYQRKHVSGERRIPDGVDIVNVVAVLKGTSDPDRYVAITGHYDSRVTDVMDAAHDAPGANDDGSGTVAVLEAARVLSKHRFAASIAFGALAGEEQGLFGGRLMAELAQKNGWHVEAVLNNDIVGNIEGQNGVVDNTHVRVFSESPAATTTEEDLRRMRFFGGEVDGPSRQVARYVDHIAEAYMPNFDVMMIYRLDRFGRGGDHRAFNDLGFPAVRVTEPNETYTRQHQDLRAEDGIAYGDVLDKVNFPYLASVTALNAASLASLAWAPAAPDSVTIAGAVRPSATLRWQRVPGAAGYKVYWRETTLPTWNHWLWAGDATEKEMTDLVVDNYFFGVASVGANGDESPVVFPMPGR